MSDTRKTFSIGLQPTQSLAEAGKKVFGYHFHNFLKYEDAVRADENVEALHDMRVATRQMRAALRIFGQGFTPSALKFLKSGLKKTAQVLGAVRDLDVFIEKFTAYQREFSPDERLELAPLLEHCQLQRDRARTKLLAHLDSKTYKRFKAGTTIFVKEEGEGIKQIPVNKPIRHQIRHVVSSLIYSYYEALRGYEPFLENASIELLHQLRIDAKHFRYAVENFQEILGRESAIVIAETKQIQNHLGDLNDAEVACQFLENFLSHWKNVRRELTTVQSKKPAAITRYFKVKSEEREHLLITFPESWHQFNSTQLRHHLALAIAVL
jgi:CHAD domain-containing protein